MNLKFFSYKALRWFVYLAAIVALVVLYVAVVGVSLDLSSQRERASHILSESLGREVRFDGALQFDLSAQPKIRIGGLHIANAPGFAGRDFASLGEARLALDLWPLFHFQFKVDELSGRDGVANLQINSAGKNNWTFQPSRKKDTQPVENKATLEVDNVLAHLNIQRIALDNLQVEFVGSNAQSHFFELTSLVAKIPAGQAMTLNLQGVVEKKYPYQLTFSGGELADLAKLKQPWPIALSLQFMSSRLSLNGHISAQGGQINFGLGTENLTEFEQLLQTKLPAVGVTGIAGEIHYEAGKVTLTNLTGAMGKTTLNGHLQLNYGGDRPKLQGELNLPQLDLRPFLSGQAVKKEDAPPQSLADVYRQISQAKFDLKALNALDADLTLRVGEWLSLPGNVRDASLQVKLEQGRLTVPVRTTVAQVTLSGSATVDARVSPARFKLQLGTHDSSLGNLAGLFLGMPDVQGSLKRLDLRIATRGDQGLALMNNLDLQLQLAQGDLRYGNGAGQRPVHFSLEHFLLALPVGKALRGEMRGTLLDKPFTATLSGAPLSAAMSQMRAPLELTLTAGSARAKIQALLQADTENTGSEVIFDLAAPHSGELAAWLGLKPHADAPIQLHGNFHTDSHSWHLADFTFKLGRSDISADILRQLEDGKPLIKLKLMAEMLDMDELRSLQPETPARVANEAPRAAVNMIDIPILPTGLSLADADIDVDLQHIVNPSPLPVSEVRFDGHIRDGMMETSPFSAQLGDDYFSGAMLLDLRGLKPHAGLWLSADGINIGNLLNKLSISKNVSAGISHIGVHLDLHASRLGDLLAQSDLLAQFEGGYLTLKDANTQAEKRIELQSGELSSAPGAPVKFDLLGSLDYVPITISIETAKALDLINPKLPFPFKLYASTSGAAVLLSGELQRPFSQQALELSLNMSGSRFDNLNDLTHTSLPPWGPWSASGQFRVSNAGYAISALQLQVGSSQLTGQGSLNTQSVPPRIEVSLSAPSIQLDDFRMGDWSAEKVKPKPADPAQKVELAQATNHTQQVLSRAVLSRQNAYITVRVGQVMSGQDLLGNGSLDAQLENGRAQIGPIMVNTPGGSASMQLTYQPTENDVAVHFQAAASHFDYGVLARRVDHKSEMQGIFSLDVDVNGRTQYLANLLRDGQGHIDFAVWPKNLKSGLLDIWAVNALMALLPAIDSSNASKVNCAIGRFVLKDGQLSEKSILIDTSRMRVKGTGKVNFATETLQLYAQPQAKTPQFLSFAIPIELSGSFKDFHVGVRAADVLGTVGELSTSLIWVPLKMMFGEKVPADGRDVCSAGL